ncbi:MAG: hypothetical protein ACRENE_28970 [Polyangiaceae bacterium]
MGHRFVLVTQILLGCSALTGCRGEVLLQEPSDRSGQASTPAASTPVTGSSGTSTGVTVASHACVASVPPGTQLPIPGLQPSYTIAADGAYVYLPAAGSGPTYLVQRISVADCSMVTLNPYGGAGTWGLIALDATHVYSANGTSVVSCPKTGCPGASGMAIESGFDVWGLTVSSGYVYFSGFKDSDGLSRVAVDGGPVQQLVATGVGTSDVLVAGGNVIYSTGNGRVSTVPIAGGASTLLYATPDGSGVNSFVASATDLYLGVNSGNVLRLPLGGGQPTTIATNQGNPQLAIDDANLYWTSATGGSSRIRKMALGGTSIADLLTGGAGLWSLAIDDAYVYFTCAGLVCAVPK